MIAVSVVLREIGPADAPLWLAAAGQQIMVTTKAGTLILRDVSIWHRASKHGGTRTRVLPCFRFSTAVGRETGSVNSIVFRHYVGKKFSNHLRPFISCRPITDKGDITMLVAQEDGDDAPEAKATTEKAPTPQGEWSEWITPHGGPSGPKTPQGEWITPA